MKGNALREGGWTSKNLRLDIRKSAVHMQDKKHKISVIRACPKTPTFAFSGCDNNTNQRIGRSHQNNAWRLGAKKLKQN